MIKISAYSIRVTGHYAWSYAIAAASGSFLAIGIVFLANLQTKWIVFLFLGLFIASSLAIFKNREGLLIGILVFSLPFHIDQILFSFPYMGGSSGLRIAIVDLIIMTLIIFRKLNIRLISARMRSMPLIGKLWLVLFSISLLSFLASGCPYSGLGLLIEMLRCFFVFLIVANYYTNEKRIRSAVFLLAIGVGIQGIIAMIQYTGASLISGLDTLGQSQAVYWEKWQLSSQMRPGGTLGGPNDLAHYLVLILPLIGALILNKQRFGQRAIVLACLVLGYTAMIVSFSRIGWIGLLIGLSLLGLTSYKTINRKQLLLGSTLVVLFLSISVIVLFPLIEQRLLTDDYGAAYSRIPMMKASLNIVRQKPLLGIGINNYCAALSEFDNTGVIRMMGRPHPVHNAILLHFAELGILGGFVYLAFWYVCLKYSFKVARQPKKRTASFSAGILAGLLAESIFLQVQWGYIEAYLPFWVLLGLLAGLAQADPVNSSLLDLKNRMNLK